MNMINYVVEYEYTSFGICAVLLALFFARRKYPGMTNRIYVSMLFCTLLSCVAHIAAIRTLPVAQELPVWLNYLIHILYLVFYDFEPILFMMYSVALTKRNRFSKTNTIFTAAVIAAELILLMTTPFTRLVIYFDENMQYQHGPLFCAYPIMALLLMIYSVVMLFNFRRRIGRMQLITLSMFVVFTVAATVIQLFVPEQVVGNYAVALAMIMFLIVLQNPDDFTDKSADCFNADAFYLTAESRIDGREPFTAVAFRFEGLNYINNLFDVSEQGAAARAISERLRAEFGTDEVYHLGGCEFAMFTSERRKMTEKYVTDKLLNYFSKPVAIHGIEAAITPKICLVRFPDFASSAKDVRDAIEYTLRNSSREEGSVFVAAPEAIQAKKRELHILGTIKNCIVNESFEMYYQPIYEPTEKGFVCAEALIRMKDPELGFVSPEEFIPLAEANGMIIEIGDIAFRKVCRFMKSGQAQKLGVRYVEVNLSVLQCVQEQLSERLMEIMKEYGIPPEQINFEITETAGLANYDVLLRNMNSLISHGVTFSMDDYGTGFSTANYLISLPMDIVKIDKSILWPAMENKEAFVILRHTVEMLKSLNKRIVVEGVETEEMAKLLIDMGCDYLQGYYYQKPVPEDKYVEFLKENQKIENTP